MAHEIIAALEQARTLAEFGAARAPLGLHQQQPRFLHLELDLVNRCNIRCIMCFHSLPETRNVRTTYLGTDEFARVAERLLPHAYHLSLSLGNEPLMSPHFSPILRVAAQYAVPNINFFTNGLLLDDRKADAIIECGVTQLCFSIDGATAPTYNAIRRDGDFDRVIGNVSRFIARRNAAGSRTPVVRFDFVMMQRNVHEMVDLVELAARLGAGQLNFCHMVSYEGLDVEHESLKHTKALSNYWLERALARAAALGLEVPFAPAPFALDDDEAAPATAAPAATPGDAPFLPTPYCPFPFFHISMGPGGHVLPCPYAHGEAPYGQVSDATPIDQIWLGPKFAALRRRILEHDPPDMCRRCAFLEPLSGRSRIVRDPSAGRVVMETRPVGRTGVRLSVVGLGTAQLQMMPERVAIETLTRGIELGVNWIHTAPDYGGIDPWIRAAIEASGREVMVASAGSPLTRDLPAFFENTCHVYGTWRLAMFGIAGIDDIEWFGENLWGRGGMVEYLQEKKAEGRLDAIYCSTHADAGYVAELIERGVFDAIMLAWNPLGFHQQSQLFGRRQAGRTYEDLREYQEKIFPLAAARGVSLLVMKPFAGGLLCKGKALPPHDWFADAADPVDPGDVLRLILEQTGVTAVVPGAASPREAEENALAGRTAQALSVGARDRIARAAAAMRLQLCSRCGDCEDTCSRRLAIPAMFRDGYIWTSRNETSMANPGENYFDLHPSPVLACVSCTDRSCLCPQGIDIPSALARVDARMHALRGARQHPGPSSAFARQIVEAAHRVLVLTADVPARLEAGVTGVARFLLRNLGGERWLATQHTPERALASGVGLTIDGRLAAVIPLRNTVCPEDASPVVFEFQAPPAPGSYTVGFVLLPLDALTAAGGTRFHTTTLVVHAGRGAAYDVVYRDHSIPQQMNTGVTYGVQLTFENAGTMTWETNPAAGGRIEVLVSVDEIPLTTVPLPVDVPPGAQATVHLPFRADDLEGRHQVQVELVHRGVTAFADAGVPPWTFEVSIVRAGWTETVRLAEIERKHNPWHYNPFSAISRGREGHPFPLFVSRAKGCRLWDVEGNEFLDYTMGWGSTILGHAHDRIQQAVRDILDTGAVLPAPHPVEMELSRELVETFPHHDMVVFGKNGSDVCTVAARLARIVTGRRTILSSGFHGWQDFGLEYFEFKDCGIPFRDERCLYKFPPNDRAAFLALYDRHKDDLAAVLIEPAAALVSEEAGLAGEADTAFLQTVADAARRAGALLIFDEIKTGFRYRQGSVQAATGVIPDLTCLGKALASGLPLSAVLGSARVFLEAFHRTHFCPTFGGEVYSLAAARAALAIYREHPVADYIWRYGARLRDAVDAAARRAGVAGRCSGPPFHLLFVFAERDGLRRRLKRTLLMQELLKAGVFTVSGMMLPSYAHDEPVLALTEAAFDRAFELISHADRTGQLHRYVDLPLL